MPLASIKETLKRAAAERFAVPLFDAFESAAVEGIFAAIEERRAPTIVAIYDGLLPSPAAPAFAAFIREMATASLMPVSLMLDHGSSEKRCERALELGFTDVMYDGSSLPISENIAATRRIVQAAHAVGAGVEAELGHVGKGSDYERLGAGREGFTNPDDVSRFVEETRVDFLAVAIGTAHGVYQGEPRLDLDLLGEIRAKTDIPLVLHGGTGLSEEQYRAAIRAGIAKINISTDLIMTATEKMVGAAGAEGASYLAIIHAGREAYRERCSWYLDLFGASGKGER